MIGAAGYRPAIFAIFEDIVIGTIHAPSIPGGDVSYIKGIYSKLNYECKCHNLPWAFMGDMNIDLAKDFPFEMCDGAKPRADSLNEIYIEKTSSSDVRCLLAYPEKTHKVLAEREHGNWILHFSVEISVTTSGMVCLTKRYLRQ